MRHIAKVVLLGLAVFMPIASAYADVRVSFLNAQRYGGFGTEAPVLRDSILNVLRQTMVSLGARYLKPNQTLSIDVLDLQRAGALRDFTPNHPAILTDATPPRIEVHYRLQQKGKTLVDAHENLSDVDYLVNARARFSGDSLVYEKQLLQDWFAKRFATAASQ